jgi:tetracycline resistance efflux pump
MDYGLFSLLPSLIAIAFALYTREVLLSLIAAIIVGDMILIDGDILEMTLAPLHSIDRVLTLFSQAWIVKMLLFALLVGSVITLISRSGGVVGFVEYLESRQNSISSKRGALLLAYGIGLVIFIESSITALIAGTVARPLCDKHQVSREKLAYVCDSTSAPVCSLIPFNGWGALLLGLITTQISLGVISGNAVSLLGSAIMYNFYAWVSLAFVLYIIASGKDFGAMKKAEARAQAGELIASDAKILGDESLLVYQASDDKKASMWHLILPILFMIIMVPIVLYITGEGDIMQGSGSSAIFYAVLFTVVVSSFYYKGTGAMTLNEIMDAIYKGAGMMLPIAAILIFAFAIGDVTSELKTGHYLATIVRENVAAFYLPALVFLLGGVIAFSTGTSWGTFSIMIPIAIPMASTLGVDPALAIAAVISGGVFGDHCSPISDTTIVSSMAAMSDHIDHVNTQLPYALVCGGLALLLFLGAGIWA